MHVHNLMIALDLIDTFVRSTCILLTFGANVIVWQVPAAAGGPALAETEGRWRRGSEAAAAAAAMNMPDRLNGLAESIVIQVQVQRGATALLHHPQLPPPLPLASPAHAPAAGHAPARLQPRPFAHPRTPTPLPQWEMALCAVGVYVSMFMRGREDAAAKELAPVLLRLHCAAGRLVHWAAGSPEGQEACHLLPSMADWTVIHSQYHRTLVRCAVLCCALHCRRLAACSLLACLLRTVPASWLLAGRVQLGMPDLWGGGHPACPVPAPPVTPYFSSAAPPPDLPAALPLPPFAFQVGMLPVLRQWVNTQGTPEPEKLLQRRSAACKGGDEHLRVLPATCAVVPQSSAPTAVAAWPAAGLACTPTRLPSAGQGSACKHSLPSS